MQQLHSSYAAAAQHRGFRCYAGPKRAMQRQQGAIRAYAGPARAVQGLRHPVWGYAGLSLAAQGHQLASRVDAEGFRAALGFLKTKRG